ncbi:MAG: ribonuclease P protein component [Armatimonadota bacterium]
MLPEVHRLRSRGDFQRVFSEGKALELDAVRLVHAPGLGRMAVVVSKSVGSLARRNQVRRRWREALRGLLGRIPQDRDMVLVVRSRASSLRGREVREVLEEALANLER